MKVWRINTNLVIRSLVFVIYKWKMNEFEEKDIMSFLDSAFFKESFEYKHRALHCKEKEISHNGVSIFKNIKMMLENWVSI